MVSPRLATGYVSHLCGARMVGASARRTQAHRSYADAVCLVATWHDRHRTSSGERYRLNRQPQRGHVPGAAVTRGVPALGLPRCTPRRRNPWHGLSGASQTLRLGRAVDSVKRDVRGVSRNKPNGPVGVNLRESRMSIRVCLVIVVVVAVAAAAALVGSAARGADRSTSAVHWALLPGTLRSASTPRIAGTQRLTVYASDFAATSVDNAPSGTSQGDELAVTGQLRDAGGTKIGKLEVHEVLTSVTPRSFNSQRRYACTEASSARLAPSAPRT